MSELTYRSTDIRLSDQTILFDLVRGYSEPAEVRGIDQIVPAAAGIVARNRVADHRVIELAGYIYNATSVSTWRSTTDTVMALFDKTLDPGALVLDDSYLGVASAATINARTTSILGGIPTRTAAGGMFQTWSITLESLDPDWS